MTAFKYIESSSGLPVEWDEMAENYFQQRVFLAHTALYNPCHQRYYIAVENDKIVAAAVVYSLRLDIFTYISIKSPLKMNIVGIPCSVSSPGVFGNKNAVEALKKHICTTEKGFVLLLNLTEKPTDIVNASGKTLPTIVFSNSFTNWNDYLASLRSNYRRRLKMINRKNENLRLEKKDCSAFTEEMHRQYLQVYKRSSGKLEKLSFEFFRNLPSVFILTVCYHKNAVIGWNIALSDNNIYYFFLGGIDYKFNRIHNTYFRSLKQLIQDGIESKAEIIELGQTAEIPKMRMGGKPEILYMEAHHSNMVFNKLIKMSGSLLEYKMKAENTRAIKEEL